MESIVLMTLLAVLLVGGAQGDTALELMLQALGPEFSDFATAAATDLGPPVTTEQYTLFAPTNTAFEAQMACINSSSVDHTYREDVLKYHFINVSLTQEAIVAVVGNSEDYTWQPFTFYNQQQLNVTVTNSTTVTLNGVSHVIKPDLLFNSHAVVHGIDDVLIPPSLQVLTTLCRSSSPVTLLQGLGSIPSVLLISLILAINY